jgi:hypothetical protein
MTLHHLEYGISLVQVTKVYQDRTDSRLAEPSPETSSISYPDSIFSAAWTFGRHFIHLRVTATVPLIIRLNEIQYVDENGNPHQVVPQKPIGSPVKLEKGGTWESLLYPTDYRIFIHAVGDSTIQPLLPFGPFGPGERGSQRGGWTEGEFFQFGKGLVGKELHVLLPLEVEGVSYIYTYRFVIQDFRLLSEHGISLL